MKVYVVSQAVSDDDGNFYSTIEGVYLDESKALSKVKEVHDEIVEYFNDPEDNYEDGDKFFEIYESDDLEIRRAIDVDEKEVE